MRGATRAAADEPEGAGLRAKRLRTENLVPSSIAPGLENGNSKVARQTLPERSQTLDISVSQDTKQDTANTKVIPPSKQHRPSKTTQVPGVLRPVKSKSRSASSQHPPILDVEAASLAQSQLINEETDFSHAPSDPFELANWVAQVICRIHNGVQASVNTGNGHDGKKSRSSSLAPGSHMPQNGYKGELVAMSELEMKRNEGRLRKQRWRSEHREQSMSTLRPHSWRKV